MSIRYSQDFKDSLVKLHQEGRSLKSLAEEFGPSKDSIAIWVAQKSINWTIFIQLLRQHLRYDCDYKN